MRGRLSLAVAALACALACCGAGAAAANAGHGGATASIIGGKVASIEQLPSLAFVIAEEHGGSLACTGTVIAPRVVLTAAHCVENLEEGGLHSPKRYVVATGVSNPHQAKKSDLRHLADARVFPGFEPGNLHGDAAVLILDQPTAAPPIAMAGAADAPLYEGGAPVTLAGWGLMHANAVREPRRLRSAPTVLQAPTSCKTKTRRFYPVYSTNLQMCTADPPKFKTGGCFGDSGGPALSVRADGTPVELGITSTGGPQCSTKLPNIFTRVDRVSAWAAAWVAATETGAPPPHLGGGKLPTLTRRDAKQLVVRSLLALYGERFLRADDLRGSCKRAGRVRMRCDLAWRTAGKVYFGTINVFYERQREAVVWQKSFAIHRVSVACAQARGSLSACPDHVRRG